ncbi:type II toxin-antitoxin system HipA family toxin [Salegentibacter salegens]|uniref:Serine/threonine-protein kinase HipA n=1 Tax=Salegentibacter salegens TaxID=143223 RepID=A0A1M7I5T9_9FLAO|nr:HipA domain-containing protein [Salegentibacter salegens]PRX47957.1 serine/threonine-protein kinase HipA [Salegentibacter salegens]SHM36134.1 serine/threonine-protein kinase HipA [Salegentibacter salegens]
MAKNTILNVKLFKKEIGKLGYDLDQRKSFFQYNPEFLETNQLQNIFPYIIKRIKPVQVFSEYEGNTFKGLPPAIADSLPDMFGNIIFKEWFEANNKDKTKLTPLEQLTYVANRGMGALEYEPAQNIPKTSAIDLEEIISVLKQVIDQKEQTSEKKFDNLALLNIFKMGTSAGGARPKLLISENIETGEIIPGDIVSSKDYKHYLVKLSLNEDSYNKEVIEYAYFKMASAAGITMMPSKLINTKHFITLRYDRQNGAKQHVLTASGMTGWDFQKPENSSYENLFKLALDLKVPYNEIQELFKRMVFNLVFANIDDHLKNHSFIYDKKTDKWNLAPAYDLTYPLNVDFNYHKISRALSINNKRDNIQLQDLLALAEEFSIKNPKGIIEKVQEQISNWPVFTKELNIPEYVVEKISKDFKTFI